MAWKFPISTNTGVTLGATDDVYVAEGVVIGVAASPAIDGSGADHKVEIYGTIVTDSTALNLHHAVNSSVNYDVLIGDTGNIITKGFYAIRSLGGGATIENKGKVEASGFGVYAVSTGVSDANTIVNSGSIYGGSVGIYASADAGVITKVTNTGTIGGAYSYLNGTDNSVVINKGIFSAQVLLSGGDDKYDGRSGTVKALVSGGDGVDTILGGKENNVFQGDGGNDKLLGGLGADKLTGGNDADLFIFKSTADSTVASAGRDTILDFSHAAGDTIDLHSIDARTTKSGDQAFKFIDSQAFHHVAGELRFQKTSTDTFVSGDVNGDGKADFAIKLTGLVTLSASDFIL